MKPRCCCFLTITLLFIAFASTVQAADYYWENPVNIRSGNSFYPQFVSSQEQGYILTAWQEYSPDDPELVSIRGAYSRDGLNWSNPQNLIPEFRYVSEDNVSLFSMSRDRDGNPILSITASEREIHIYRMNSPGMAMERISAIETEYTSVVPRIFRRADGSLILFLTGKVVLGNGTDALSIYASYSSAGNRWTVPEHFINDDELKQNFLPYYSFDEQREYVVFQSLYTGKRNSYQIYLKSKALDSTFWEDEIQITSFDEYRDGSDNNFAQFDNQRPHMVAENGRVHIVWERRLGREQPQIYYGVFDFQGTSLEELEQISRGSYFTAAPRVIRDKGETLVLWFDNRSGNQVVMAQRRGVFWQERRLSLMPGDSTYARWIDFNNDFYVLWENLRNEERNMTILAPDKSAPLPIVHTVNFTDRGRQADDRAILSWKRPEDSSGVLGFSYVWDTKPDTEPERDEDFLDLREKTETFRAVEDGDWYFHIALMDYAGNWSDTRHVRVTRDTIPPDPVQFFKPLTDAMGYLISNTFTLTWKSEDENLGGYSFAFHFLGEDADLMDPTLLDLPSPPDTVQTVSSAVQYNNRDNGYWALSVSAFDDVGNKSNPAIMLFRTNKYIPVTYISDVQSRKDELERVVLTIVGRGFSAGGRISKVILDKDGKAPWDYEYSLGDYRVRSDRIIDGPTVEVFNEGIYRIAVEHPRRGIAWASGRLRLDSSGTVRFGDFSYSYKTFWQAVDLAERVFSLNTAVFYGILFILFLICLFSVWQLHRLLREGKELEEDIKAILDGTPFKEEISRERLRTMKQRGMGLRLKFTLALLSLILAVILLISLFLGNYMLNTQKQNLSEGLYEKSSLLLETLATSARTYLPTQNRLELGLLPGTIRAMDEALSTTITGQGANDPDGFDYIWSSNNSDINLYQTFPEKVDDNNIRFPEGWSDSEISDFEDLYKQGESYNFADFSEEDRHKIFDVLENSNLIAEIETGISRITDPVTPAVEKLKEEINERAVELIGDQNKQLGQLSQDAVRLALRGDRASLEELSMIQETISRIEREINDKLSTVSNVVQTYPEFATETLNRDRLVYTFYKPILYRNQGRENYFRGIVRLDVSIESILDGIVETQSNIVRITVIISLLALGGGLAGALLLAQTMINPIRRLVAGVERVRDTQDKSQLAGHSIETGTRDELAVLASTFNQMTDGLVKAAAANKDLIMGKEIQKKFIPLGTMEGAGGRKLSTGEEENEHAHFFGYYEGAQGVSGDYFDLRRLDDKHYAIIKCDISGKGIPAALIMVEVATLFIDHFSKLNVKRDGIQLEKVVYNINDLLEQVGFEGRFAAFIINVINIETGQCWLCHAGDRDVYYYDGQEKKVKLKRMDESPAAGVFSSDLVQMGQGFKQVPHVLKSGDIMFLFTDGIEEAQRHFRNSRYEVIDCDDSCGISKILEEDEEAYTSHKNGENFEELGIPRMEAIIEAALQMKTYNLEQYHKPDPDIQLSFDFSKGNGTMKEAVLALISVEKVNRLVPDPDAGPDDRIRIDNKIDEYLKVHFDQYRDYFKYPIPDEEYPEYTYYSHMKEDKQFDDLTILGIRKK